MDASYKANVTPEPDPDDTFPLVLRRCWYDVTRWTRIMASCRLCRSLTITAFIAVLLIESIILIPSYRNFEEDLLRNEEASTVQTINTFLATHEAPLSQAHLLTVLKAAKLNSLSISTGQEYYSAGPALSMSPNTKASLRSRRDHSTETLDLSWSANITGKNYDVLARVELTNITAQLVAFVIRIMGLSVLIALVVTGMIIVVVDRIMLSRLMRLRSRIVQAGEDAENPLLYVHKPEIQDEFGEVEDALNQMLKHSAHNLEKLESLNLELDCLLNERTRTLQAREQELEIISWYDQLTGLANRSLFEEGIRRHFEKQENQYSEGALIVLGIDDFQTINGLEGHNAGDYVLREIAQRLHRLLSGKALTARLGGDIFAILASGKRDEFLPELDNFVQLLLRECESPIALKEREIQCEMSIGVSVYPNDGNDTASLLQHAEIAMHRSKQLGSHAIQYFSENLGTEVQRRNRILKDLRHALPKQEFLLYFQPQFDREKACVGYEALLRWQHSENGMISPAVFIPLAESSGLIAPIGLWVLDNAIATLGEWRKSGFCGRMAVNLSAHQIKDENLATHIQRLLQKNNVPPSFLELEITESALMEDVEKALDILAKLKALGVEIAVDDFGTGYSSLAYLKRFPVSRLKIDRAFVMGLPDNTQDQILCRSIIDLSHNMGFKVIAEGVEQEEQLQWLNGSGCDEVQGYLLGKPEPRPQFQCKAH